MCNENDLTQYRGMIARINSTVAASNKYLTQQLIAEVETAITTAMLCGDDYVWFTFDYDRGDCNIAIAFLEGEGIEFGCPTVPEEGNVTQYRLT